MPDDYTEHFLLVYSNLERRLVAIHRFPGAAVDEASAAYTAAEREHPGPQYEVVLISANTLDTIKRTHGHYFTDPDAPLAELLSYA